jgi:hypothetical protein
MLSLDLWFRQQLWLQLWKCPGAVATYLSMPVSLICVGLSAIGSTELEDASLCILSLNVVLGILLILADEIGSCRNHHLGFVAFLCGKQAELASKSSESNRRRLIVLLTDCG